MKGTTSTRPRSPRRVLRGETPLTPRVPTDLRAAYAEAIDELYGWPEDVVSVDVDEWRAITDWREDEDLYAYEADFLDDEHEPEWKRGGNWPDEPDDPYMSDDDLFYEYRDSGHYHDEWLNEYDYRYQASLMQNMDENDAWNAHVAPYWIVEDQTELAWQLHDGPRTPTTPLPAPPNPLPPQWDRTHPLYGLHPTTTRKRK